MLYKLNEEVSGYEMVKQSKLEDFKWKEKDLENIIANNIEDFINTEELMTIFTEKKGQKAPDIMALDKNGDLYILELKRVKGTDDTLLQVLGYGQQFGNSCYDNLNAHYQEYTKDNEEKTELIEAHQRNFNLDTPLDKDSFNTQQHFLIVTNGVDDKAKNAINYWRKTGLNIDAITYFVYQIGDEKFIEFTGYSKDKNKIQPENKYYIVNTDIRSKNKQHHVDMIEKHKAAAYNDGFKEKISKLKANDTVFLYESKKGIVGYGIADGILNKVDENGKKEFEYNMNLNEFINLSDNPISAKEMKTITDHVFVLMQTMLSVPEKAGEKLVEEIKRRYKKS